MTVGDDGWLLSAMAGRAVRQGNLNPPATMKMPTTPAPLTPACATPRPTGFPAWP